MHNEYTDPYEYDSDRLEWFDRFSMRPVEPNVIDAHLEHEEVLHTVDLPAYLGKRLIVDTDTGLALYRLVQLFGTPNVPGLQAGADQPEREAMTWIYCFDLRDEAVEGDPETHLLSIYDWKTNVSVGLSGWQEGKGDERGILEPTDESNGVDVPTAEDYLVGIVQLALNVVEESVPATYKDLWV